MPSGVFDSILLRDSWSTQELRNIFNDQARVQAWYDIEVALAREQAAFGIIPEAAARDIAAHARVENVDLEAIAVAMQQVKHPLVPSLRALQALCTPEHGEYLHFGPTTQDILDTGTMLQLKQAHTVFLRDLTAIGQALFDLAKTHRATPMTGRTHGVQALPITFRHKCAVWLREVARHRERLLAAEARIFVGSMVGAVGSMASFGSQAIELEAAIMRRLGLGLADISWQPARDRFVEYVSLLGLVGGTLHKICNEVFNLQRNEIDELQEPFNAGKVGSSTMPHKRNPSVVEGVITVGHALRHNVALMYEAMVQEHERDGAMWKVEWKALPEACLLAGRMLATSLHVLSNLIVNTDKMRENLDLLGGFLLSERMMFHLSEKLGKQTAHEVVYEAAMHGQEHGTDFETALLADPRVSRHISADEIRTVLDPTTYLGLSPELVDRALAQTLSEGWITDA